MTKNCHKFVNRWEHHCSWQQRILASFQRCVSEPSMDKKAVEKHNKGGGGVDNARSRDNDSPEGIFPTYPNVKSSFLVVSITR